MSWTTRFLAGVLTAGLLLGACGDDDDSTEATAAGETSAQTDESTSTTAPAADETTDTTPAESTTTAAPAENASADAAAATTTTAAASTGATTTTAPTPPPVVDNGRTLTEADAGTMTNEVAPGERFRIVLPSNGSTGYHWELVGITPDGFVTFEDMVVEEGATAEDGTPLVGAGGTTTFTFVAGASGSGSISLENIPPGGEAGGPNERYPFNIDIVG